MKKYPANKVFRTFFVIIAGLVLAIFMSLNQCHAQKPVKVDADGNYTSVSVKKDKEPDKATDKFFIDSKGVKYPILKSANGKLYYLKTSKNGNEYRVYIVSK